MVNFKHGILFNIDIINTNNRIIISII